MIKFACDSLRSYGNRLKICLRLLATPCDRCRMSQAVAEIEIFYLCDSLRLVAIHCDQWKPLFTTFATPCDNNSIVSGDYLISVIKILVWNLMKVKFVGILCDHMETTFSNHNYCNSLRLPATLCDSLRLLTIIWKPGCHRLRFCDSAARKRGLARFYRETELGHGKLESTSLAEIGMQKKGRKCWKKTR